MIKSYSILSLEACDINFRKGKKKFAKHVLISSMLGAEADETIAEDVSAKDAIVGKLENFNKGMLWHRMEIQKSESDRKDWLYARLRNYKKKSEEEIAGLITNENILMLVLKHYEGLETNNLNYYDPILCTDRFVGILKKSEQRIAEVKDDPEGEYDLHGYKFSLE